METSRILRRATNDSKCLFFWCPGCKSSHLVMVGDGRGPRWGWNGDVHRPTFTPSIKVTLPRGLSPEEICHTFVTDGVIDFLGDCTHALRGKHPIPDWPKPDYGGTVPLERPGSAAGTSTP